MMPSQPRCGLVVQFAILSMGKAGTIWQFFRALFPSTWRTLSSKMLCLPGFGTHANTPRICHIFVLSLLVCRSTLSRNADFSWQTLNCQIVPVLPSYFAILQGRQLHALFGGCQHPSPNVKNALYVRAVTWPHIITSSDAKSVVPRKP